MGRNSLIMTYVETFDNGFSNKYEINLKNKKNPINIFFYS
jgi:hypothetical protein